MKNTLKYLVIGLIAFGSIAAQAEEKKEAAKCPISGKDVNPKCTTKYEGKSYWCCPLNWSGQFVSLTRWVSVCFASCPT